MKLFVVLFLAIVLVAQVVSAEVYRWMDEGNVAHLTSIKPDWWTDEMDMVEDWREIHPPTEEEQQQQEAAEAEQEEQSAKVTEEEAQFIGDSRTSIFHNLDCRLVKSRATGRKFKVDEENRVFFRTAEEAENGGYKPCTLCNPGRE